MGKISYDRRAYESVDDMILPQVISQKSTRKREFEQCRVKILIADSLFTFGYLFYEKLGWLYVICTLSLSLLSCVISKLLFDAIKDFDNVFSCSNLIGRES